MPDCYFTDKFAPVYWYKRCTAGNPSGPAVPTTDTLDGADNGSTDYIVYSSNDISLKHLWPKLLHLVSFSLAKIGTINGNSITSKDI